MGVPKLVPVVEGKLGEAASAKDWDAVLLVVGGDVAAAVAGFSFAKSFARLAAVDGSATSSVNLLAVGDEEAAGGRVVVAPTGPLDRDYDDVRQVADAARAAVARAKGAGAVRPLLYVLGVPLDGLYENSVEVALLGILASLYQPIQARETAGAELEPVTAIGFVVASSEQGQRIAQVVGALEEGRRLGRDIGSGDPERMAAPRIASYLVDAFKGSDVQVEVVADRAVIEKDYPLAAAVARASFPVERHHPRIVRLTYTGPGETDETLLFAGKGITYDTGGADVKYGGHMAGMHMDKGGAAGIAGFVKTVSLLKPKGLKVVAELGFVRNSIGSDSYVSDEIVRSHGGKRVMVANTDAEGRMVLADCLSHMREIALKEKNPRLMTCATLTGHAHRAVGNYGITLDNGPAFAIGQSVGLQKASLAWGDPFEVSTLRKDDYAFVQPKNAAFDVLQCNLAPSSGTARGRQFPAAFLVIASGLEGHGNNSKDKHLPFSHIDIAGSAAEDDDYQFGRPTGTPIVPLTARYVLGRL